MASYHLNVKTISRSQGRSATAAAAYRAAERIVCDRYGIEHDYTRKAGVVHTEILAPDGVSDWINDRAELWNAVEAKETRKNSVVAREWEIALPSELSDAARRELARDFAWKLVERYDVVADVAIHAPHRDGDQRNHHAHILTTTRRAGADGFGEKTRELDVKRTSSIEVTAMRATWAELQNTALEREGEESRVDHRSLEEQREEAERIAEVALEAGRLEEAERMRLEVEALHRQPEPKLGPHTSAIERRAKQEAERDGIEYVPVTERGAEVAERRAERSLFEEVRERFDVARDVYAQAREQGEGRREAVTAALKALVDREREREVVQEAEQALEQRRERERGGSEPEQTVEDRLKNMLGREDVPQEEPERSPEISEDDLRDLERIRLLDQLEKNPNRDMRRELAEFDRQTVRQRMTEPEIAAERERELERELERSPSLGMDFSM